MYHSGQEHVNITAYEAYFTGKLEDYTYPQEKK